MKYFSDKVIEFNGNLKISCPLPQGVDSMNPFKLKPAAEASSLFYQKYYRDNNQRYFIAGINPGRFGAGVTGIPFTDTKRLKKICSLSFSGSETHEPSSVFIYDVIGKSGGPEKFYSKFYINSVCPLGFTMRTEKGREINYNYYDDPELVKSVYPFIISSIRKQISFGLSKRVCFCLGTGKNYRFLNDLNSSFRFFKKIVPLEHPRYIMQYKSKDKLSYIKKYLNSFNLC
ncbi:MAG: DUF4918 family protein [Bacteroidetes bacterium]|nr:DUF4918 family protein [Bacteroidota bacterium]